MQLDSFSLEIKNHVAHLAFNRPHKSNSLHREAWAEMKAVFEHLDEQPEVRVIILSGEGKNFCAGIDLALLMELDPNESIECEGRKREEFRKFVYHLQDCITTIERCRKPVLAAIHGACIGGGVDIVTACDMRYVSADAYLSIKEVDMGLVADIGTLQRLPKLISYALTAELAYTGRKLGGVEAAAIGLANKCYADRDEMMNEVSKMASMIAAKSPLVIRGTKEILQYTRDHSVEDSLKYMGTFNAAFLSKREMQEAFKAQMSKEAPSFDD